jgi:hypothetical protein
MTPILIQCFTCLSPVHHFEEDLFGCDTCKAVWKYEDGGWVNIKKKRKRKLYGRRED